MRRGSRGSPLGRDIGHCLFHVNGDLVLGVWVGSQAERVTKPLQASVVSFVICECVLPLLHDGSEHGLELECLGSNPESITF